MGERGAWSAAGGAVIALAGTNAVSWAVAAAPAHSPLPEWPAVVFGFLAVVGIWLVVAPLVPLPPFRRVWSTAELLDGYIREGHRIRDQIAEQHLLWTDALTPIVRWQFRVVEGLRDKYPALHDEFASAVGSQDFQSSVDAPQTYVAMINTKLAVLAKARQEIGSR